MFSLPSAPPWEGMHPLVVHFPIALLMVSPILILIGLLWARHRTGMLTAALIVMALGTLESFVAVATGEAAGQFVDRSVPAIEQVLEEHEELGETTRNVFTALTVVYAALIVLPWGVEKWRGRPIPIRPWLAALILYLAVYGIALLLLANTAHLGGRLVHEFGVRAQFKSGAPPQQVEKSEE